MTFNYLEATVVSFIAVNHVAHSNTTNISAQLQQTLDANQLTTGSSLTSSLDSSRKRRQTVVVLMMTPLRTVSIVAPLTPQLGIVWLEVFYSTLLKLTVCFTHLPVCMVVGGVQLGHNGSYQ